MNFSNNTFLSSKRKSSTSTISNITNTHNPSSSFDSMPSSDHNTSAPKTPSCTPPRLPTRPKAPSHDRFIPNRSAMDLDVSRHALCVDGKENGSVMTPNSSAHLSTDSLSSSSGNITANRGDEHCNSPYSSMITASLLQDGDHMSSCGSGDMQNQSGNDLAHSKILSFTDKAPAQKEGYQNSSRVLYAQGLGGACRQRRHKYRHIASKPEKILDAPNILDDYYLNLVDWGSNNILAVALAESVYLWHAETGEIEQLCDVDGDNVNNYVTSVSFIQGGQHIAVGTNSNDVQIWDVARMRRLRSMRSHTSRVGALAWNNHLVSSGSRDGSIHHHDVRVPRHHIASLVGHTQEVCGLKWNATGTQLASGANDNTVRVWDHQPQQFQQSAAGNGDAPTIVTPKHTFTAHTAAVKALAWCPWQTNLLATGGGTADRFLRFWNTSSGTCVNAVDTKSQVCSVVWNPHDKELLTSHGFSQNQLTVWKYPSLVRMAELQGHTSRVLHTALSPDGQTVVSGAADETLRFWKVFADSSNKTNGQRNTADKGLFSSHVRSVSSIR